MAGNLGALLTEIVNRGASDLHLVHGSPPCIRHATAIQPLGQTNVDSSTILGLVTPFLMEHQLKEFQVNGRLNVSFTLSNVGRFRMNLCKAQGTISASIRAITSKMYPLSSLGLPNIVAQLTEKTRGIIFVTGATGSGKSTTMAAMIDHINRSGRPGKVITIEDPIEVLFKPEKCIFVQREVGTDVPTFELGIQDSLRQDPDILVVGEMRTADSMRGALTAAETGHLVITTLHTPDAAKTAQRVTSAMAQEDQEIIRDQLCNSLEAVISQELLPRSDGKGMVLSVEILLATPAVRRLIKEGKLEAIYDILQTGTAQGMISKDASIKALYQRKAITRETALAHMRNPELLGPGA
ncbi:MAG: PilT/PilU family type 4a pilus ATPase [Elusimicrobia bacterium]|nr:PilT/PilU family type 4a pilus ATPase [Elusimicrobiota bacterium]